MKAEGNKPMIDYSAMVKKAERFGVHLQNEQLKMLDKYSDLLVDWNTRINLTAITDPEGIMTRHFEDCIAILKFVEIPEEASIIDVGTGAGFPGMVLKIVRPDLKLTLLDSLSKRINFLSAVSEQVGLSVNTVHLRAEEGGKMPEYREKYDFSIARAVSNLRELAEYCLPYVKIGGKFVSMKGPDVLDEIDAAKPGIGTLGGKIESINDYHISDGSGRTVIVVNKMKSTPAQFPRPSAKIKKKPL